jgi:hypothetical protein
MRSTIIAPIDPFMLGNCTQCVPNSRVRRLDPTPASTNSGDPALLDIAAMT